VFHDSDALLSPNSTLNNTHDQDALLNLVHDQGWWNLQCDKVNYIQGLSTGVIMFYPAPQIVSLFKTWWDSRLWTNLTAYEQFRTDARALRYPLKEQYR